MPEGGEGQGGCDSPVWWEEVEVDNVVWWEGGESPVWWEEGKVDNAVWWEWMVIRSSHCYMAK